MGFVAIPVGIILVVVLVGFPIVGSLTYKYLNRRLDKLENE